MDTTTADTMLPATSLTVIPPLRLLHLLCLLSILMSGCAQGVGGGQATPTPVPLPAYTTYTVQRGDIIINTELAGQVEAVALNTVFFPMDGHVDHVYVQLNETVTKGQLLADLTELKDLQAKAEEIRHAVDRADINLAMEQERLAKYKEEGYSSHDVKIQEFKVQLAEIDLQEVLAQYGLTEGLDPLEKIEAQLDLARVYAPADGVILSAVTPGRAVTTTIEAFVIGDPDQLEVVAEALRSQADEQFKQMYEGMPVEVILEAKPNVRLTGKISQLPSPYGTGEYGSINVRIVLDQKPSAESYQSGDKVKVRIQLANKKDVLWLPPVAVHQVSGRSFVIIDSDAGPQRVEIVTGVQMQDKVEILSGLEEGQVVIAL